MTAISRRSFGKLFGAGLAGAVTCPKLPKLSKPVTPDLFLIRSPDAPGVYWGNFPGGCYSESIGGILCQK